MFTINIKNVSIQDIVHNYMDLREVFSRETLLTQYYLLRNTTTATFTILGSTKNRYFYQCDDCTCIYHLTETVFNKTKNTIKGNCICRSKKFYEFLTIIALIISAPNFYIFPQLSFCKSESTNHALFYDFTATLTLDYSNPFSHVEVWEKPHDYNKSKSHYENNLSKLNDAKNRLTPLIYATEMTYDNSDNFIERILRVIQTEFEFIQKNIKMNKQIKKSVYEERFYSKFPLKNSLIS